MCWSFLICHWFLLSLKYLSKNLLLRRRNWQKWNLHTRWKWFPFLLKLQTCLVLVCFSKTSMFLYFCFTTWHYINILLVPTSTGMIVSPYSTGATYFWCIDFIPIYHDFSMFLLIDDSPTIFCFDRKTHKRGTYTFVEIPIQSLLKLKTCLILVDIRIFFKTYLVLCS